MFKRHATNRRRRGYTLMEMITTISLLSGLSLYVVWLMVDDAKLGTLSSTGTQLQYQAKYSLDLMSTDIHDSQYVLAASTYSGTAYTTDTSKTLVLQAPAFDSTGTSLGTNDVIIYTLTGNTAPYSLHRIVNASTNSARSPSGDQVLARNVISMSLIHIVDQSLTGDGSTKAFSLYAPISGSGSSLYQAVSNGGSSVSIGSGSSQAQFSSSTLTFGTAPASNAAIDAAYSVSPSASASYVNQVYVDLKVGDTYASNSYGKTPDVEVTSQCSLRNH